VPKRTFHDLLMPWTTQILQKVQWVSTASIQATPNDELTYISTHLTRQFFKEWIYLIYFKDLVDIYFHACRCYKGAKIIQTFKRCLLANLVDCNLKDSLQSVNNYLLTVWIVLGNFEASASEKKINLKKFSKIISSYQGSNQNQIGRWIVQMRPSVQPLQVWQLDLLS
jgi:hypothetical protein